MKDYSILETNFVMKPKENGRGVTIVRQCRTTKGLDELTIAHIYELDYLSTILEVLNGKIEESKVLGYVETKADHIVLEGDEFNHKTYGTVIRKTKAKNTVIGEIHISTYYKPIIKAIRYAIGKIE